MQRPFRARIASECPAYGGPQCAVAHATGTPSKTATMNMLACTKADGIHVDELPGVRGKRKPLRIPSAITTHREHVVSDPRALRGCNILSNSTVGDT